MVNVPPIIIQGDPPQGKTYLGGGCHGTHWKIRGHLAGVCSVLPHVGPGIELRSSSLVTSAFTPEPPCRPFSVISPAPPHALFSKRMTLYTQRHKITLQKKPWLLQAPPVSPSVLKSSGRPLVAARPGLKVGL